MASSPRYAGAEADPHPFPPSKEHIQSQPAETQGFILNHVMYRIKDPSRSLPFYQDLLGLRSVMKFNTGPFTIYYLGYSDDVDEEPLERMKNMQRSRGLLELVHIHGTELDANFSYTNGNDLDAQGFGHVGITVPDVPAAMERFERLGADIVKRIGDKSPIALTLRDETYLPGEGFMNGVYTKIGFLRDPDGYWIEIVPQRF